MFGAVVGLVSALQPPLQAEVARGRPFALCFACFAVRTGREGAQPLQIILVAVMELDVAPQRVPVRFCLRLASASQCRDHRDEVLDRGECLTCECTCFRNGRM